MLVLVEHTGLLWALVHWSSLYVLVCSGVLVLLYWLLYSLLYSLDCSGNTSPLLYVLVCSGRAGPAVRTGLLAGLVCDIDIDITGLLWTCWSCRTY
jgi:hypothetical protein